MDQDFARLIDEADVHGLGMQIDAAVELMLLFVESHHEPPCQISWDRGRTSRARQTLGHASEPVILGQAPPPGEAMMSIKGMNASRKTRSGSLRSVSFNHDRVIPNVRSAKS
jgi:hypothetical protein